MHDAFARGTAGLSLPHALLLLEYDDVHGTSRLGQLSRAYGLCGAVVAELQVLGRLRPVRANVFAITQQGEPLDGAFGLAEQQIGARQLSLKKHLGRLGAWGASKLRAAFLDELVQAGHLRREQDKLLFVTWRVRYPEQDPTLERDLIAALRRYVDDVPADQPPGREDLLLSLLRGLRLLDAVWTEDELITRRERIDERTRLAPIGRDVRQVIRDAEAAAAAAGAAFGCPAVALNDDESSQEEATIAFHVEHDRGDAVDGEACKATSPRRQA